MDIYEEFGVSRQENPFIIVPESTIRQTLQGIIDFGFSREQVIKIVFTFPATLGCSWKRTEEILNICKNIGFNILNAPYKLVLSPKTLQSRINFLRNKFEMRNDQVLKIIFRGNKRFEEQFGISKEELLRDYLD